MTKIWILSLVLGSLAACSPTINLQRPLCYVIPQNSTLQQVALLGTAVWLRDLQTPASVFVEDSSQCLGKNPPIILRTICQVNRAPAFVQRYWNHWVITLNIQEEGYRPSYFAHELGHILILWGHVSLDHDSLLNDPMHVRDRTEYDRRLLCHSHPELSGCL